jgi:uncharacterized transporter YbjL
VTITAQSPGALKRSVAELGIPLLLVVAGYSANARWNTHVGGWREVASVAGGVVAVTASIVFVGFLIARMITLLAPSRRR